MTDRARLEELLGEYWEIAFEESSGVVAIGNKANRVLHEIRALFYALAAPATAPAQPERKPMTKGQREQVVRRAEAAMNGNVNLSWRDALISETEAFHDIKEDKT